MGLEALCECRLQGRSGQVKALLETKELILRGDFRRTLALAGLRDVQVREGELAFRVGDECVILNLGAGRADRWAARITAPPRTLAQKLGVTPAAKAVIAGIVNDPALREALDGCIAASHEAACMTIAMIPNEAALQDALRAHEARSPAAPIWMIHGKGGVGFGETAVRKIMRDAAYIDTKVCGVSDALSATRYIRRRDSARG